MMSGMCCEKAVIKCEDVGLNLVLCVGLRRFGVFVLARFALGIFWPSAFLSLSLAPAAFFFLPIFLLRVSLFLQETHVSALVFDDNAENFDAFFK